MDQIASILGVSLPSTQARTFVMRKFQNKQPPSRWQQNIVTTCERKEKKLFLRSDDDTVSTCSLSGDELEPASLSFKMVTFANPLVTQVRERPRITKAEKRILFYQEAEYYEMRREASSRRRRNRLVTFADSIISDVWTIPHNTDISNLFYSENELQQFLDEFVASLDKGLVV